jgi:hypothetical protein
MILEYDQPLIVVDSHVHLHGCFELSMLMDSVFSHSREVARLKGYENNFISLLLLAEGRGERGFETLIQYTRQNRLLEGKKGTYRFLPTKETYSLAVVRKDSPPHYFVAGRQIQTIEKLEVLALASDVDIPDGLPLEIAVRRIAETGAIPVIPWGFGKWTGRRKKVLANFLENRPKLQVFLGDNSGRPNLFPHPKPFTIGRKMGVGILPGSDPLPFPSEAVRPGSFGFTLKALFDPLYPANEIRKILRDHDVDPIPFGQLENPLQFLGKQYAVLIRRIGFK